MTSRLCVLSDKSLRTIFASWFNGDPGLTLAYGNTHYQVLGVDDPAGDVFQSAIRRRQDDVAPILSDVEQEEEG